MIANSSAESRQVMRATPSGKHGSDFIRHLPQISSIGNRRIVLAWMAIPLTFSSLSTCRRHFYSEAHY